MSTIDFVKKNDNISWEEIQKLLYVSHKTNDEKGLRYGTMNQTIERLLQKQKNSECYTVLDNACLCGCVTFEKKYINNYFIKGEAIYLKLLAIKPEYRGRGLGQLLLEKGKEYAIRHNVNYCILDSTVKNVAIKKLAINNGYKIVGYCRYSANNFISAVYVKSLLGELDINPILVIKSYFISALKHYKFKLLSSKF